MFSIVPSVRQLIFACLLPLLATRAFGGDFDAEAQEFDRQVGRQILPYWYDTAVDWKRGGYLLAADAAKPVPPASDKQIVTQARMVWGFAHAHLKGYRDARRDYLKAASTGYNFLVAKFLDPVNGGYYWTTDLEGQPLNERKILYGESFVIYAFVEYYRASLDRGALDRAMELFRVIQRRCHDLAYLGWGEHYTRDWRLISQPDERIEVEVAGLKSANAHLHWMEALSELYEATGDLEVKSALNEALSINATYFYPRTAGQACFHRQPDWSAATEPRSAGLSYGHNVEFAWLMIRAQRVLGRQPDWRHFQAIMDHALNYGYDWERGGLYHRGVGDEPPTDTDKVWWVQAELMAALTDGLKHRTDARPAKAQQLLIRFLKAHQIDPQNGIWYDTVTADGQPKNTALAHNWKANYHDLRAILKFVDAFKPTK